MEIKLLDEKEVNELFNGLDVNSNCDLNYANGLRDGIEWTERKLTLVMIEFAEWIDLQYKEFNKNSGKQLFEQFLKYKQWT